MTPATKRPIFTSEANGRRYFIVRTASRPSGRRYFVCQKADCESRVLREADLFCRLHAKEQQLQNQTDGQNQTDSNQNDAESHEKDNSSPTGNGRISTEENETNTSDEQSHRTSISSLSKIPEEVSPNENFSSTQNDGKHIIITMPQSRPGTNRFYRDASGKIRFLCSISTCRSRVARQADYYCRRHQIESLSSENHQKNLKEENFIETRSNIEVSPSKRVKLDNGSHESRQIALATTTLTDESWEDLLKFLRHFPESQLSLNLNVNDSTTHLIVDDHESNLHCTITKKVVQAAVRRHIFIISHRWLNECVEKKSLVDEQTFEIVSDSHTTMRTSAQNFDKINKFIFPSNSTVLYAFAIECRQCQGSINRAELVELIHLTGAQLFQEDQAVDVLIVLCDINDRSLTKIKEKYAEAPASSIKFVASDFLLKTIVKFEIQDIEKYAL